MQNSPTRERLRRLVSLDGHIDRHVGVVTVVGTVAIILEHALKLEGTLELADDVVLFFVVPMAIILLVFRESPREYGLQLGDWRAGLVLTIGSIVLITPIIYFLVRSDPAMRAYYGGQTGQAGRNLLELFVWEFLFRGWWLFGYARAFGANAIWLQAVPFALAHIGKPESETISTILGGFVFGWIAYRTRSMLYPLAIHFFVLSFTILVAAGVIP